MAAEATPEPPSNYFHCREQVWAKPQAGGSMAVLIVNNCAMDVCAQKTPASISISLAEIWGPSGVSAPASATARDLHRHVDLGKITALEWAGGNNGLLPIADHDGHFVLLTPAGR
jgi:hypothetical protein